MEQIVEIWKIRPVSEYHYKRKTSKPEDERDDAAGLSPLAKISMELAPYLGISWTFVMSIVVFGALGWWLDEKLGTGRKLAIAGMLFGIVVGFGNFIKVVTKLGQGHRK